MKKIIKRVLSLSYIVGGRFCVVPRNSWQEFQRFLLPLMIPGSDFFPSRFTPSKGTRNFNPRTNLPPTTYHLSPITYHLPSTTILYPNFASGLFSSDSAPMNTAVTTFTSQVSSQFQSFQPYFTLPLLATILSILARPEYTC